MRFLIAIFPAALAFAAPQSGTATAVPTMRAETRVVQIEVVVKDSHGRRVGNLSQQDFIVTDQNKPRAIDIFSVDSTRTGQGPAAVPTSIAMQPQPVPPTAFSNQNPQPPAGPVHTTVILLDHVNSTFEGTAWARQGVLDLMNKVRPDERIAVYVIGRLEGLIVLQDYTTNRELLLKNIREYVPRYMAAGAVGGESLPAGVTDTKKEKSRYSPDAVERKVENGGEDVRLSLQTLSRHLALLPGRKSVYWVSQGFPARQWDEDPAWRKTITALNEADVSVNAISSAREPKDADRFIALTMRQIAEATGGQAWFHGSNDIAAELAEGIGDSRTTYSLGFYLAEADRDDTFHSLRVEVNRPGLQLSYRRGYYAGDTDLPVAAPGEDELPESVLLNEADSHDVGISADVETVPGDNADDARGTLNIRMSLDTRTLLLEERGSGGNNVKTGKAGELFVELDENGRTVASISDTKDFELAAARGDRDGGEGTSWPVSIPLAAGAVKLTIIVRDMHNGRVGSLTVPLTKISAAGSGVRQQ